MPGKRVAIVDSGGANIASLLNALERLGVTGVLTRDADMIRGASHVILPGVGSAAIAMQRLDYFGLVSVLTGLRQPVLGICLGMQLLARSSDEHGALCLNIIPEKAVRLQPGPDTPVPNTGWCRVRQTEPHSLFHGIEDGSYFYFVHGYALPCNEFTLASAEHAHPFAAALACRNFLATQFHPERSGRVGTKLLRNFLRLNS